MCCIFNWSCTFSLTWLHGHCHLILSLGAAEAISPCLHTQVSRQTKQKVLTISGTQEHKQFNPYYRIHWIQLNSSKVTPESKIVLALHFIYSYEGITGYQDSLLIPSVSTLVTRLLHTFTLKTLLKPWPSSMTTCFVFMKIIHFHLILSLFSPHYCCHSSKPVGYIEQWLLFLLSSLESYPWKPPHTML